MMRAFIAAELGREARDAIEALTSELNRELAGVRWIRVDNMHLTLKFLGDVEETFVDALISPVASSLARVPGPFEIGIDGVGTFGARQPRVIWAGVEDRSGLLARMQQAVEEALAPLGIAKEKRSFSPHITLARLKNPVVGLARAIGPRKGIHLGVSAIDSCVLFKSILGPGGARHERLHLFPIERGSGC